MQLKIEDCLASSVKDAALMLQGGSLNLGMGEKDNEGIALPLGKGW